MNNKLILTSTIDCIENIEGLNINRNTKLIVLPFAHSFDYLPTAESIYYRYDRNPANKDSIFYDICNPFINIGIDPANIVIINHYTDNPALIKHKIMAPNTLVYLPGGQPENIVTIVKKLGIRDALLETNNVILGCSAGSMMWSYKFFVWKDNVDYNKYQSFKGLKIIKDFCIVPHFVASINSIHVNRACRRFKRMNPRKMIYLMQDGGYIIYDKQTQKIIDKHMTLIY